MPASPRDNPARGEGGRYPGPDSAGVPEDDDEFLVRPYTVTRGRTAPQYQLEIEAMVASSHYEAGDVTRLSPECQAILELCRDWRSVAEVSAILRMPLGVARILITDLASEGLVRVEQRSQSQARPDTKLLERVLQGIRRLLARAPWPAPARVRARAFALRNAAGPVRTGPSRARGGAAPVAACR